MSCASGNMPTRLAVIKSMVEAAKINISAATNAAKGCFCSRIKTQLNVAKAAMKAETIK